MANQKFINYLTKNGSFNELLWMKSTGFITTCEMEKVLCLAELLWIWWDPTGYSTMWLALKNWQKLTFDNELIIINRKCMLLFMVKPLKITLCATSPYNCGTDRCLYNYTFSLLQALVYDIIQWVVLVIRKYN